MVAYYRAKQMQRSGYVTESHRTLSIDDVQKIFDALNKVAHTLSEYRDRLVFALGLRAVFRLREMYRLTLENKFARVQRDVPCIIFRSTVGGIRVKS